MNVHSVPNLREATANDADNLAKLIDIAGEGIPTWLWSKSADAGQSPLEIGAERARRTSGGFSFTNAVIAEANGETAGMVLSYAIDTAPEDDPDDLPAPIAPFIELERHSVGTWYINALAVFASCRGQGIGSKLMEQAERAAQQAGYSRMSIQVYGQNHGAVRLYERLGYERVESAAVRLHPCQPYYTGDVLLLVKSLAV